MDRSLHEIACNRENSKESSKISCYDLSLCMYWGVKDFIVFKKTSKLHIFFKDNKYQIGSYPKLWNFQQLKENIGF